MKEPQLLQSTGFTHTHKDALTLNILTLPPAGPLVEGVSVFPMYVSVCSLCNINVCMTCVKVMCVFTYIFDEVLI